MMNTPDHDAGATPDFQQESVCAAAEPVSLEQIELREEHLCGCICSYDLS